MGNFLKRSPSKILLLLSFLLLLGGCALPKFIKSKAPKDIPPSIHIHYPPLSYKKEPVRPQILEDYIYETSHYTRSLLSFPSSGKNGQEGNMMRAYYYKSKTPGKKRLILILPIYGSSAHPSKMTALYLTEWNQSADTNVLLIRGGDDLFFWDDLEKMQNEKEFLQEVGAGVDRIKTVITDIRRLLDWAETQKETDASRIGIVGFSISGMIGAAIMGVDERISAGVFAMAGAHPSEIIARSRADFLLRLQEHVKNTFGWTEDIFYEKLFPIINPIDPEHYTSRIRKIRDQVLVVEAEFDDYMPENARADFWEALGKPDKILLPFSHKTAFIFGTTPFGRNFISRETTEFLEKKLK